MLAIRRTPFPPASFFSLSPALSLLSSLEKAPSAVRSGILTETDDGYTLTVEIPGLRREDVSLKVTDRTMQLEGRRDMTVPEGFAVVRKERPEVHLHRSVRFSTPIDPEQVSAALVDGVLTITLPRAASARARQITIT